MPTKNCACCGEIFITRPQVPNQSFCSAPACQRERRQRWQRDKMLTDPDYRDNQSRSQRAWLDRNPDYWRKYRGNGDRSTQTPEVATPADRLPLSGLYRIRFDSDAALAKSDAWLAEITPVCLDCPCKKDACKDRT